MKRKGLPKLIIGVGLVAVLAISIPMISSCARAPAPVEPVVVGFIGSFASDTGLSTLRGAEMAIEEYNAAGGILGGRPIKFVKADDNQDVNEGVKAYEYLAETEKCDLIISGSIDDVSSGWFERMAEYKIPTLDTWTSSYLLIQKVNDDYDKYKMYFMNIPNDWLLGIPYIDFGRDVLNGEYGWETFVLFQEDTAYAQGVGEWVLGELGPEFGMEAIDHIVYDINTVDFAPIYASMVETDPDFIYHISSVNCLTPTAQYVELQVPLPITGINVALFGEEVWTDTGGMVGGVGGLSPQPCVGMPLDAVSQDFTERWRAKYPTRPVFPHFNGFNAYYGIKDCFEAAERAGGFDDLDAWVEEMEATDWTLYRYGGWEQRDDLSPTGVDEAWFVERYYSQGDIEPITGMEWTHNAVFDPEGKEGKLSVQVIQWYEDGTVKCVYPPRYANGTITFPSWMPDDKLPDFLK